MNIDLGKLKASPMPLKGFSRELIQSIGAITFPFIVGQGNATITILAYFLVVKAPSSYNVIIGHPTLNEFKVVKSTYYLKMKFPSEEGVREVQGEQKLAQ